jgi:peroxiredoxin
MINPKAMTSFLLLFWFSLVVSGCTHNVERQIEKAAVGSPAPDFALKNFNGQAMSLSDHKGKVVLLDFWEAWCEPCRNSIPYREALYQKYKDRGFVVIGISFDQSAADVQRFRATYKMSYPTLMGEEWIKDDYGVGGVPETFVIDRNGILKSHTVGFSRSLPDVLGEDEEIASLL